MDHQIVCGIAKKTEDAVAEVNLGACHRLASLLTTKSIPVDREESDLPEFSKEEIANFYFFLVAICHQTSPPGKLPLEGTVGGARRRGWDYLTAKFEEAARSDPDLLVPSRWTRMSSEELSVLYGDGQLGERLTGVERRVELIRDLGHVMQANQWSWLDDLYLLCDGRVASGNPNLYGLLAMFQAYRDPVRKKSSFLLSLMRNTGLWRYIDDDQLGVPVDYHEIRGHLRIGTVSVKDENLRRKLLDGIPVTPTEDVAIRETVCEAITLLSELTGLRNPSQLHYLFWNVFRSCCTPESPHCQGCPSACTLPDRYVPLASHPDGHKRCSFSTVCGSANISKRYYAPVFETDYY